MGEIVPQYDGAATVCAIGEGLPLHTKFRPTKLDQFAGNTALKEALNRVLEDCDRRPQVYLFSGPSGCGKTTLGRIVASRVGAEEMDVVELDASAERGINEMREMRRDLAMSPLYGPAKLYLLDEAHGLTRDAQNALLKSLEDCRKHSFVVLCSTEPDRLLETVRQRCTHFEVTRLGDNIVYNMLVDVCEAEGFTTSEEILDVIVEKADGIPRNALTLLGITHSVKTADEAALLARTADGSEAQFQELTRAILQNEGLRKIISCYRNMEDRDPIRTRVGIANYCKTIVMTARTPAESDAAGRILQYMCRPYVNY